MFVQLFIVSALMFIRGCQAQGCQRLQVPSRHCVCVGELIQFECTASGTGTTIWEGSAFSDCTGSRIVLRHSQFTGGGTSNSCNSGGIVGYSAGDGVNDCYTSRLNVSVRDTSLEGQTVLCTHVVSQATTVIGNYTISLLTEQNRYPPPDDISVIDINQYAYTGQLRFNWSLPTEICPSAYYEITHINCGTCPDTTMSSNFTCENVPLENTCNFVVRRVVCGSIKSGPSRSVSVVLKVPRIETIDIVPLYDDETNLLKSISTTFQESESFFVSDGIDGSATSYTITYTNPRYGLICNRAVVPASQCVNGICSHHLNLSSSNCSAFSEVRVSVFGTNVLGNGTSTNPVTIGYFNRIVRINIRPLTLDVVCTFLNDISHGTREKRCSIVYGPEVNCSGASLSGEGTASALSNSVRIDLPELPRYQLVGNQLCFIITASDGLNNVSIEGTFNAGCDRQQLSDGTTLTSDATNTCGSPLHSVGIKNGIACFASINPGATAFYMCAHPDSGVIKRSARTCLHNGTWNGTIPLCEAADITFVSGSNQQQSLVPTVSLSALLLVAFAGLIILTTVIILLRKTNTKLQHSLRQARSNAVYDVIESPPLPIRSNKNVAYSSVNETIVDKK